jgi:predicted AlkP superfamily pyrophosphatase or phosphodiesterase
MKYLFIIFTLFILNNLFAQTPSKPKLVVGIIVDQMRQDYIYRYWDKYSEKGIKKLVNQGFNCKNTQYNYVPTYTGPGHASIYTGTTPCYHGIAANDWFDRKSKSIVYCADDKSVNPFEGSESDSKMSPKNLLASTITDELELFTNRKSIVIGASIKNRGAIMPAGHLADAAYWFDKKTGKWTSSSFYMPSLTGWVSDYNKKGIPESYLNQTWNTLLPIEKYTESLNDNNPYESKFKGKDTPTFPYNLSELKEKNSPYELLVSTPFGNDLLKDFTLEILKNEAIGDDDITDFLALSFSSTDLVGHRFSPNSIELEDTYLRLDLNIAELISEIEKKYGEGNVLFFLTADHAGAYNPQYLIDNKMPAGYFNEYNLYDSLKFFTLQKFGNASLIDTLINGQVYLNRELLQKKWYPFDYFQKKLAEYILTFEGVANVATASELQNYNYTDGLNKYNKLGTHKDRSGDLIINLEPAWLEPFNWKDGKPNSTGTTHGMAYRYDTHVPLLWYGWQIKPGETSNLVNITDIAPTISSLINIPQPNSCIGNPISSITDNTINKPKSEKNETIWNTWH